MKTIKHIKSVFAFLSALFFAMTSFCGCKNENNPNSNAIVIIGQGDLFDAGAQGFSKQFSVITTEKDWENFKSQLNSVNKVTDNFKEKDIDFSSYLVVAVIDEVKGNGGWSIDVTDVTENSDNMVVTISNTKTGNATSVITQPFQVVKIPVSSKPILFNDLTLSRNESINCNWQVINGVTLSDTLINDLDSVFSEKNEIFSSLSGDTLLQIINTQQDFIKFCANNSISTQLNFDNYTIIAGKFRTNSISNTILDKNLFYCQNNNEYKFEVNVEYCTACYCQIGHLYFWNIFLKINTENIQLVTNKKQVL